jgi:diacylglycerol kinase family enzyme
MQRPPEQRPPVLLIPAGSGNDVARMLGLQRTPAEVERRVFHPGSHTWDVIKASLTGPSQQTLTRYGINVLSTGITAEVLRIFNRMMRRLPPDVGYAAAGVLAFSRYRAQPMEIIVDDYTQSYSPLVVAIADDGLLNLTTAHNIGSLGFLGLLPKLRKGAVLSDSRIRYSTGRCVQLRTPNPLGVEMDGEFIGFTPLTVEVIPNAIRLIT